MKLNSLECERSEVQSPEIMYYIISEIIAYIHVFYILYMVLINNSCRAPVAVGFTNYSSEDMMLTGLKGRGVCIMHVYNDLLW